jgi:hypothetical protein
LKHLSGQTDYLRQTLRGGRLTFLTAMMTILCHAALAEPLDVYRYENRLIVVSIPQAEVVEQVSAMFAGNRD